MDQQKINAALTKKEFLYNYFKKRIADNPHFNVIGDPLSDQLSIFSSLLEQSYIANKEEKEMGRQWKAALQEYEQANANVSAEPDPNLVDRYIND
jgi:glutamate/tyrosine decarboxylase-like PLP-dependent enzyme